MNNTGSDFYAWNNSISNNPIVLDTLSGNPFDLSALDVGSLAGAALPVSFDITGFLSGGGTVVANMINVSAFVPTVLGWTDLTKVEFNYVSGRIGAIDNLIVFEIVPEPTTTLLLLPFGLVGLRVRRRLN